MGISGLNDLMLSNMIQVSLQKKVMVQEQVMAAELLNGMQKANIQVSSASLERSVSPHIGSNIDIRL